MVVCNFNLSSSRSSEQHFQEEHGKRMFPKFQKEKYTPLGFFNKNVINAGRSFLKR